METAEQDDDAERTAYFAARYEGIFQVPFVSENGKRILLRDHAGEEVQRCRFCKRARPDVTFKRDAHAFPDFLGNRSVFSLNECDSCNARFGTGCEDHLSKATMLARVLAGIPRKKGKSSTFKSDDETLRIDATGNDVNIHVPSPHSVDDLLVDGRTPDEIELMGDTSSQAYIPLQAVMALVKTACSVCPVNDLRQCEPAIDWLMGRQQMRISRFPIYHAFTPGPINDNASEVRLLRRKGDGPEPYLWCLVQFRNFRYQVFVPGCPADTHWARAQSDCPVTLKHVPSKFGTDWPFGKTVYSWGDWAGTKPVRTGAAVSHVVNRVIRITRPSEAGENQAD